MSKINKQRQNTDVQPSNYNTGIVFKNHYNSIPDPGEINPYPSETVPDQTLTIPQILERHARGLPVTGTKMPIYEGEDDILEGIDFRTLDISEKYDFMKMKAEELKELQIKTQAWQKAKMDNDPVKSLQKEMQLLKEQLQVAKLNSSARGSEATPPAGDKRSASE